MYKKFVLPLLLFAFVGAAQAEVLDFGPNGSGTSFFKKDVNAWYIDATTVTGYNGSGYESMVNATGNKWVASNYAEASPISFVSISGLFDLDSMWLAGAWGDQTLTITGWANGVQVFQDDNVKIGKTAQEYFFTGFKGIDTLTIERGSEWINGGNAWVLGSMAVTPVPEPEAYAMLLAGLGMVGVMVRRRQRS